MSDARSMQVPMLDLGAQLVEIGPALEAAVLAVVRSTAYINGPAVAELERQVAGYLGSRHGVGVSSGTDALLIALMALGIGPGDLVVTTGYSFFATAGVVSRLGATPVFVDIEPGTCNLDPAALAAWFSDHPALRRRVKAIIAVHLYGQAADLDAIVAVAAAHDVPVIEDAAQAIGAGFPGRDGVRRAGTVGRIGALSFFPSKNLGGLGDGGMVVTDDAALAERLRRLRAHGAEPKHHHAIIGGNFRLDTLQAAALLVKLPHLDDWNQRRRDRAARYDAGLVGLDLVTPTCRWGRDHHVYNQYVIEVGGDREALRRHLQARGVETAIFYPVPFHLQPCFADLGYQRGALPCSERAAARTLALPMYPELTSRMQDHVIDAIRDHAG